MFLLLLLLLLLLQLTVCILSRLPFTASYSYATMSIEFAFILTHTPIHLLTHKIKSERVWWRISHVLLTFIAPLLIDSKRWFTAANMINELGKYTLWRVQYYHHRHANLCLSSSFTGRKKRLNRINDARKKSLLTHIRLIKFKWTFATWLRQITMRIIFVVLGRFDKTMTLLFHFVLSIFIKHCVNWLSDVVHVTMCMASIFDSRLCIFM